jgi:hypothetical protein
MVLHDRGIFLPRRLASLNVLGTLRWKLVRSTFLIYTAFVIVAPPQEDGRLSSVVSPVASYRMRLDMSYNMIVVSYVNV